MGFNRRKMEDQGRDAAEKEAAGRRATEAQVLEDAGMIARPSECRCCSLRRSAPPSPWQEAERRLLNLRESVEAQAPIATPGLPVPPTRNT